MIRRTQPFAWTGRVAGALLAVLALPALAGEIATIEGTANYLGGERLPEGAVLEVDLLDLSRAREKGRLLTRMRFEPEGEVPLPFLLHYDSGLTLAGGRFSLAGRIVGRGLKGEEVLYRSTAILPVLGPGLDPRPEIFLEAVVPVADGGTPIGEKWRVERVEGVERLGFTKAVMTFDDEGQIKGNAGCNRYTASYKIDGEKLSFGGLVLTRRGCQPQIMERERAFQRATIQTVTYRREGDVLKLLNIDGLETMRLVRE
ncbi:MAG: META domain-containing protein [Pseudomonadota bacterium]